MIKIIRWVLGFWSIVLVCLLPSVADQVQANHGFRVAKIEIFGLQRIPVSTVLTYLPVHRGEVFAYSELPKVIKALFKPGFFNRISLYRQGDSLVIRVHERPVINAIQFTGNQLIKSKQLKQALKESGIIKGQVFNPEVLNTLKIQLLEQYYQHGKYNALIKTSIKKLPRNRVDVDIHIEEGKSAIIKQVVITGNHTFPEKYLLGQLAIGQPSWWAFWSKRNHYSLARMEKSVEVLRNDYLNNGHISFALDSTQLALTPSRQNLYVTLNIHEGHQYRVRSVKLTGELLAPRATLERLLQIKSGQVFSRKHVLDSIKVIQNFYGNKGYAFANINPIPKVNRAQKTINLTFFVDPGRKFYVREIHFYGNKSTDSVVLRREMRQPEGSLYSIKQINLSRLRIQRLPYIVRVSITPKRVPGTNNQVDLNVYVKARLSNSFTASIGYSQFQGAILATSVSSNNFLGTGNSLHMGINTSKINTLYNISYLNPFYTINGVSRSLNLYYEKTNTANTTVINYTANRYGGSIGFGIPLTEYDTVNVGVGYQQIAVTLGQTPSQTVSSFISRNGNKYNLFDISLGYSHDTRNRTVFPTHGNYQNVNLYLVTPGSTIHYYKLGYTNKEYVPIKSWLTASLGGTLGYGNGYGGTSTLPFFDKYYAGGIGTVAGYKINTLGPRDPLSGQPTGGDIEVAGRARLIFPVPFLTNSGSVRMSTFVDVGNVFASVSNVQLNALRASAGVGLEWLSPIGPLTFTFAKAMNAKLGDQTQIFQFNIGTYF